MMATTGLMLRGSSHHLPDTPAFMLWQSYIARVLCLMTPPRSKQQYAGLEPGHDIVGKLCHGPFHFLHGQLAALIEPADDLT